MAYYETMLAAGLIVWIAAFIFYLNLPQASIFHPATYYFIFHGLVFVVRPIIAYAYDYNSLYAAYNFIPSMETKIIVLAGATLGFAIFVTLSLHFGNRTPVLNDHYPDGRSYGRYLRSFGFMCLICLPPAILSIINSIDSRISEVDTMARDAATGYAINTVDNGYFIDAQLMLGPITVLLAWLMRFKLMSLIPFGLFVLVKAATGGRWPFVIASFSLLLLYVRHTGRRWVNLRVVVGMMILAIVFTIIGMDRGSSLRALFFESPAGQQENATIERPLESMDFGNMEFFEYLVTFVPSQTGTYDYFLDNLQILTEPIPRVIWPAKPVGSPIKLYSLFDYGYPIGMTNSLPGEGWAQLGWLGIVIWCGLFGWLYGRYYNYNMGHERSPFRSCLYAILLPLSITFFRDGFLLTMLKTSVFSALPLFVWNAFYRITK